MPEPLRHACQDPRHRIYAASGQVNWVRSGYRGGGCINDPWGAPQTYFSRPSGLWRLDSEVWHLGFRVLSLGYVAWNLDSGLWGAESGVWRLEYEV